VHSPRRIKLVDHTPLLPINNCARRRPRSRRTRSSKPATKTACGPYGRRRQAWGRCDQLPAHRGDPSLDFAALLVADEGRVLCADGSGGASLYDADTHSVLTLTVPSLRETTRQASIYVMTRSPFPADPVERVLLLRGAQLRRPRSVPQLR
jgi:hypothetical protein